MEAPTKHYPLLRGWRDKNIQFTNSQGNVAHDKQEGDKMDDPKDMGKNNN